MAKFIEVTSLIPEEMTIYPLEKRIVNIDKIYQVKNYIDPNNIQSCRIDFNDEYLNSNTGARGSIITKETYEQVVELIKTQLK